MEATEEMSTLVVVLMQLILITGYRSPPVTVNIHCMPSLIVLHNNSYTAENPRCSGQMTLTTEFGWLI